MKYVKEFIEILKLPPNILGALSLATGFILFLPPNILNKLYLVNFKEQYGFFIGLIFIICSSILLVMLLIYIIKYIYKKIDNIRLKKCQIKYLLELDCIKTEILKKIVDEPTHTIVMQANNGITIEFQHFGIITMAGKTQFTDASMKIKYFLQPWVIELIEKNVELKNKYKKK